MTVLTFLLSQWVFVYQYLKVAILMPLILNNAEEDKSKATFATKSLQCMNWTFVICTVLSIAAS